MVDNFIKALDNKNLEQAMKILENTNDIFKGVSSAKRENLIKTLDYKQQTLTVLGLLDDYKSGSEVVHVFNKFLREFDYAQLRLRLRFFYDVCRSYTNFFLDNKIGIKLVAGLKIAIQKMTAYDDGLTPVHTLFLKLCIQTKCYRVAESILGRYITCFNKHADTHDEEIYNYFYFGGHIYTALKNDDEAYIFYRFALQFSQNLIYSATLNARKKMLLYVLRYPKLRYDAQEKKFKLEHNFELRNLNFAKNLGPDDMEVLALFCKAYMDLMTEEKYYQKQAELDAYFAENLEVYEEDKNLGLVKELFSAFKLRKLKELKKVYDTYSLPDICKVLECDQKELFYTLTRAFNIRPIARIDQKNNILVFQRAIDPFKVKSLTNIHELTQKMRDVTGEYGKEHDAIIRDRISMPNTIFS